MREPAREPKARDDVVIAEFQEQPIFEDFAELLTAPFERGCACPHSTKRGDFTEVRTVAEQLVSRAEELTSDEGGEHSVHQYTLNAPYEQLPPEHWSDACPPLAETSDEDSGGKEMN